MSKKVLSVVLSILMVATLCVSASADSAYVGDGVKTGELHKGDTVTYTVNLKHAGDDYVAAIDASVFYDADVLEIALNEKEKPDVAYEGTGSAVPNYGIEGEIRFNAAEGVNGYDAFEDGANIIEVKFNVLKDAEDAEIKFEARELFTLEKVVVSKEIKESATVDCVKETSDEDSDKNDTTDSEKNDTTDTESPVTGDTTSVAVMMVVLATAALAVVIARKRVA